MRGQRTQTGFCGVTGLRSDKCWRTKSVDLREIVQYNMPNKRLYKVFTLKTYDILNDDKNASTGANLRQRKGGINLYQIDRDTINTQSRDKQILIARRHTGYRSGRHRNWISIWSYRYPSLHTAYLSFKVVRARCTFSSLLSWPFPTPLLPNGRGIYLFYSTQFSERPDSWVVDKNHHHDLSICVVLLSRAPGHFVRQRNPHLFDFSLNALFVVRR
jgi:hypothetical protein